MDEDSQANQASGQEVRPTWVPVGSGDGLACLKWRFLGHLKGSHSLTSPLSPGHGPSSFVPKFVVKISSSVPISCFPLDVKSRWSRGRLQAQPLLRLSTPSFSPLARPFLFPPGEELWRLPLRKYLDWGDGAKARLRAHMGSLQMKRGSALFPQTQTQAGVCES